MKRTLLAKGVEQSFHFRLILLREDVPLMIGNDAAIAKGFEIFIPKLAVWQTVDKSEAGVATDLVQELAAGFPAARIDEEKPPFAIQRERQDERDHGARFIDMAHSLPGDPLPPDLEVAVVDFYGRPGEEAKKRERKQSKNESDAKSGKPEAGEEDASDRDTGGSESEPGVDGRRQIANERTHNLSLYPCHESVNFPHWMRVC